MGKYTPTPEEKANGWTEDSLRRYCKKRLIASSNIIFNKNNIRTVKPVQQNNKLHPFKWRKKNVSLRP